MTATLLCTQPQEIQSNFKLLFDEDTSKCVIRCCSSEGKDYSEINYCFDRSKYSLKWILIQTFFTFTELSIVCFWRGHTLYALDLENGCPIFSWTSNRRTEAPSIIRVVKPFLVGSQIHLACCVSLVSESASLIYVMNIASSCIVRVIRVAYDVSAITVLTSRNDGLSGPVISTFVGALAIGCQSGYTLLVGK